MNGPYLNSRNINRTQRRATQVQCSTPSHQQSPIGQQQTTAQQQYSSAPAAVNTIAAISGDSRRHMDRLQYDPITQETTLQRANTGN